MQSLGLLQIKAERALKSSISFQLQSCHITIMEWLVLGIVASDVSKFKTMTEISHELNVTLPQVTALVTRLVEQKCLKQKVLASDHRGRAVSVTLKGKRVLAKSEKLINKSLVGILGTLPESQLKHYIKTLKKLSTLVV